MTGGSGTSGGDDGPRDGSSDETSDGSAADSARDEGDAGDLSPAERFRSRIRELEEQLDATDDAAEREALRRDIEHLRAGLRRVE